jgi:hypothetical protein
MRRNQITSWSVWATFVLWATALHGVAYPDDTAQEKNDSLFEQLGQDTLSPEQRAEILVSLIEQVGGADDNRIIHVLGQQMKKHEVARKVVLPRFAGLLRAAREGLGLGSERRLCRLLGVLLEVGDASREVVAEAEEVLKDSKDFPFAAPKAATLLLRLDPTRRNAQRWLGEKLQSKSREERGRAAAAIGAAGKRAEPMAAKLQPLLKDEAVEVRVWAACSLWSIDPRSRDVADVLRQALRKEPIGILLLEPTTFSEWFPGHRHIAVQCLGKMEADAREAASDIARLLKDEDQTLRWFAAMALGPIGARTPDVLKALEAAKGDSNVAVSKSAARSLALLTGEEPPAKESSPSRLPADGPR